ncbi:zinc finger protein RFP-like [Sceloporus undulatus]|uniref:zinc finger protein RFP-like n=1 Tax=Sceloporus undulatus TaxID=8520 RepID=UPI001C4AE039|nr:zinc finger protein RFP-like [Sceloporus undulatus]
MASSESPLETLQREITCSICLSYFREPVSIDCGHNFCQACIAQCWGRSEDENTSCPQCRRWSRKRSFRPNRELGNVVEVAKRLRLEAASSLAAGQRLCQKHQEPLKLFCEQDESPVCVICRESRAHKAHPMLPIEEAAQDYKKQVATHVKALKERREKLKESKKIWSAEDIRTILSRCKDGQQPRLAEVSSSPTELEKKLGHFSLKNIVIKEALDKCRETMISELAKARSMETSAKMASITLDPKSAHPLLVVSECKKSVKRGEMVQPLPNNPERFDATLILLGCERFASGIHYWEVEVGDGQNWALGVAKESIKRKGPVVTCPEEGIWALGLCGDEYKAFTSSDTRLTLDEAPEKIQVFVHYERGWVAFFDADYMSLIFIFRSANFGGEKICPFFKVWGLTTVLRMLP